MSDTYYQYYTQSLQSSCFEPDQHQDLIAQQLGHLATRIMEQQSIGIIQARWNKLFNQQADGCQGVYLWGHTGSGKTWLIQNFFDYLPLENKLFIHFHHFMNQVHEELAAIKHRKNPLNQLAKSWATKTTVICIDEFIVTNIVDAMLLYRFLDALLANGVFLIMTSNRHPQQLYENGLQRELFIPAIDLIVQKLQISHLDRQLHYRKNKQRLSDVYFSPEISHAEFKTYFNCHATCSAETNVQLSINARDFHAILLADNIVWFEFSELCEAPRAVADFECLSRQFNIVMISSVPIMDENREAEARRFMYLIDELYLHQVKLIISAAADPDHLYQGRLLTFGFHRTASRLHEMRSTGYLQ